MSHRKILYSLLIPSVVIETVIFVTSFYCQSSYFEWLCEEMLDLNFIFEPLGFILLSVIPIIILLLFIREQIFSTWKKFAIPYIILSAIFLIFSDDRGGSWGVKGPDNEFIAMVLAILFFIISIIIITIKSWRLRKNQETQNQTKNF